MLVKLTEEQRADAYRQNVRIAGYIRDSIARKRAIDGLWVLNGIEGPFSHYPRRYTLWRRIKRVFCA